MNSKKLDQISEKYGLYKYGKLNDCAGDNGTASLLMDCLISASNISVTVQTNAKYAAVYSKKAYKNLQNNWNRMTDDSEFRFARDLNEFRRRLESVSEYYKQLILKTYAIEEIINIEKKKKGE